MKAKLLDTKTITTNHYTIDYGNDIFCDIETQNDKVVNFNFRNSDDLKLLIVKNIDEVLKYHWSKHNEILKSKNIRSLKSLENFKDFDQLFYIGGSFDGEVKDRFGDYKSSVIKLSDSFFSIYCNVKRKSDADTLKEKLEKLDIIRNIKDYSISYYNGDGDTLTAEMIISDELYNKIRKNHNYKSDELYIEILSQYIDDLRVPEYETEDDECDCTCY